MNITLTVNGEARSVGAPEATSLLEALRNHLGLMGTRYGCGLEQCGCCMVLVDGQPAYACTRELGTVAGRKVTTVEGLGTQAAPHPLQQAFLDEGAMQCGYCTPGMIMAAYALLTSNPDPTDDDIRRGMERNICRCGMYAPIVAAIRRAAAVMRGRIPGRAR